MEQVARPSCTCPLSQVPRRLGISEASVKTYLHRIYEKLRLRDRLQLRLYGRSKGLT
jgi:DNA-binding NarL/FixJ family response regulator